MSSDQTVAIVARLVSQTVEQGAALLLSKEVTPTANLVEGFCFFVAAPGSKDSVTGCDVRSRFDLCAGVFLQAPATRGGPCRSNNRGTTNSVHGTP